jgi:hypothetical protein
VQNFPNLGMSLPKSFGEVKKSGLGPGVITYFDGLERVEDPIRGTITPLQGLQGASNSFAIADAQGGIVMENPAPGTIGNMGALYLEGPGNISLDANLSKRVRIAETKEFEIRLDAINILNHPNFGNPQANINNAQFGRITLPNAGNRQFVFNARLNF